MALAAAQLQLQQELQQVATTQCRHTRRCLQVEAHAAMAMFARFWSLKQP